VIEGTFNNIGGRTVRKRTKIGLLCGALVSLLVLGSSVARATEPVPRRTIAATPTTVVAPSVNWHVEGRHNGIEHLQAHTRLCPVLDHRLHETFTLSDGTSWTFQSHYCGTIDAHGVWTGVGSFEITTGSGSTLSGTFTDSAQLPSLGVPYELDVNSGTGAFAGASGSCMLDNHLSTFAPGVQYQEGIFVCDLAHGH
jgi:hypothetical protein